MDPQRWQQIQTLFAKAVDFPAHEQSSFLEAATAGDSQLFAEVQSLLKQDARVTPLDQGLSHAAGDLVNSTFEKPGQQFGPYQVRALLGEGGMAVVYLAQRDDLQSLAAIKVLRDAWMSPARRERFDLEQRTLAQLTHPAIARLYDADTLADGTPWFAMEYVKGVPLSDYCTQHASSVEDRLKLLKAVCQAVRYAHSRAVIHRDLKPSNILVQSDGSVKLLDFGIAKQIGQDNEALNPTLTGLRMMTPAYAAPEQIRGEQPGTYTDVYALGVILYELLTGRLPFDLSNRSPTEADSLILNQEPPKPSLYAKAARPKAPWADLDVLCLTALHKDPERRYASVDAFTRDIDHYLASEPLDARPDTLRYLIAKFVKRNQRSVLAAALVLTAISALVVFYTVRLRIARNEALAEAARTQRVLRFTLNLFNGGDLQTGPASDLRVTTLIDRGTQEAANLNSDPAVQAEMYETLGVVYQKLGVLDRADSLLNKALIQRQSLSGPNSKDVAASLVNLGLLRSDQAKFDDAERLVRQGLQTTRANFPPTHPAVSAATQALGTVLEARGSYQEAIKTFKEAVRLRSLPGNDKADLAASQLELANTYFYSSQYDQAESLYKPLLATYRQLFGERHPMVAEDLINLGAIQQQRARYKEAEAFHRQALDIMQAFYGPNHYKTAQSLTLVARALEYQDRYPEAIDLLQRAIAIQEKVFGPVHPNVASALNELGNIAVKRGRYDEAETYFKRIVEIYRTCYQGKHYRLGIALANLGGVYMGRKDNLRAEQFFRQALAMYSQTLPPGSLDEGITRIKLGRALLRQDRFADAHAETYAGYQIVSRKQAPTVTYLQNARQDLADEANPSHKK
jgi:serine/threonine protein kinase/Flp pilus assembly protein TadD